MRRGILLAIIGILLAAPAAYAGTAGTWTRFTDDDGANTAHLGLQRTPDGVLHGVYERAIPGTSTADILHRTVAPDGTVGPVNTVVTWPGVSAPDITAGPAGGLIAIWGGLKSSVESGSAASDDSGAAWAEGGAPIDRNAVYASPVSIENGADGTVFETWYGTGGTFVHRGTDPATPNNDFQAQLGGYAASTPNLARDGADGSLWLGWPVFSAGANNGAWVAQVDQATGAPLGAPMRMPGSSVEFQGNTEGTDTLGRWAITGRPGRDGIYVAAPAGYPSKDSVIVWRVGQASSTTLDKRDASHRQVAIAADPDGRIAVVWGVDSGGESRLFARISDTTVSTFGPAFEIQAPPGMASLWAITASAQSGGLIDVFANITESDNTTERVYHTQALAPPVLSKAVNARVVSGQVLVKLPGASGFAPLTHDSQIPVGAIVDATNGRVRIVTALPGGRTQTADFFQGVFKLAQARTGLATLALQGGNFKACGKAKRAAGAAKSTSIRKLWGAGKGKFRTKGKYATATIRGTTWLTDDRCDGTLIRVTQGSVTVRDLKKKQNVVVTRGHSYLAKR